MYYIDRFHIPAEGEEKDWPVIWKLKRVKKSNSSLLYWKLIKKISDPTDAYEEGITTSFRENTVVDEKDLIRILFKRWQ